MSLQQEFQTLDVETPIDLITVTVTGQSPFRICNNKTVVFGGMVYTGVPCQIDWVGKSGDGSELQSKFVISDISGEIGQILDNFEDRIIGATVEVKRTLSTFLDDGETPDPTQYLSFDLRINQWSGRYSDRFEFTLIPLVSLERKKLPGRIYLRRCGWIFRDVNCGASQLFNFDSFGNPTTFQNAVCNNDLDSCRLYQNTNRYGGFPGVIRNQ